jgi:uncharacterized integral membrane protein
MRQSKAATSVTIFKWTTILLVIVIIGLFIKQNMPTFVSPQPFQLNLYIAAPSSWTLSLYTLLFLSALFGFVLGFGIMLKSYLNIRRILKSERAAQEEKKIQETAATPPPEVMTVPPTEESISEEAVKPSSQDQ